MKEFMMAALPWVVIGLALAVLCAAGIKRRSAQEAQGRNCMEEGMCIGMCVGCALGASGVVSLALGLSLGMLLGEVIGMQIKKD